MEKTAAVFSAWFTLIILIIYTECLMMKSPFRAAVWGRAYRCCLMMLLWLGISCNKNTDSSAIFLRDNPVLSAAPASDSVRTTVWRCDADSFTVQMLAETAWVYTGDSVSRLRRIPAASGARFAARADTFWNRGQEALFVWGNRRFEGCRLDKQAGSWEAARLRGADFRGLGQEPGWLLEIFIDDSIVFLADYATRRIVTPYADPRIEAKGGQMVYSAENDTHALQITIVGDSCRDVMSGFGFPATVRVRLDGKLYEGCGREL